MRAFRDAFLKVLSKAALSENFVPTQKRLKEKTPALAALGNLRDCCYICAAASLPIQAVCTQWGW